MPPITTHEELERLTPQDFLQRYQLDGDQEMQATLGFLQAVQGGTMSAREACVRMLYIALTATVPNGQSIQQLDEAVRYESPPTAGADAPPA